MPKLKSNPKRFVKSFNRLAGKSYNKPKKGKLTKKFWRDVMNVIKKEKLDDNVIAWDGRKNPNSGQMAYLSRLLNARLERPGGSAIYIKKERGESKTAYKKRKREITEAYTGKKGLAMNAIYYSPPKKDRKVTGRFEGTKLILDQVVQDDLSGKYGKPQFNPVDKTMLAMDVSTAVKMPLEEMGIYSFDKDGNFKTPFLIEAMYGTGAGSKYRQTIYNIKHLEKYIKDVEKNQSSPHGSGGCFDEKLGGNKYLDAFIITKLNKQGEQRWKKLNRRNKARRKKAKK